ncbi:minor capsid protein [Bacteroidales bacterium OttesenSCG-928-C19]|nr:minor capsid protein [Bacteroidales bacterium OttesenSCG-928-C19]
MHLPEASASLPPSYLEKLPKTTHKIIQDVYDGKTPPDDALILIGNLLTESTKTFYTGGIQTDWTTPDAEMLVRLTRDVWQFSAAKNYQEMRDITLALRDENGKLREWSDFKEASEKICDKFNETWLETEYNFAIAASQSAARWNDFTKDKDKIPYLIFQTVGDAAVRPEHAKLEGLILHIDDPQLNKLWTPLDWGCRCEWLQYIGDFNGQMEVPDVSIKPMFSTNLAKEGLIYPKGHPYYNGIPKSELHKAIAYLPPENTYIDVVIGNHEIKIHPLHGDIELEKNIDSCNILLKHDPKAKLELLPVLYESELDIKAKFYSEDYVKKFKLKNADVKYNGKIVEFEEPSGKGNSIKNTLRNAKEQANTIIMRVDDDVDMKDVLRKINGQMNHYKDDIKYNDLEIFIMNNNEFIEYKKPKR